MKGYWILSVLFFFLTAAAYARPCYTRVKIEGESLELARFHDAEALALSIEFLVPGQKIEARFSFAVPSEEGAQQVLQYLKANFFTASNAYLYQQPIGTGEFGHVSFDLVLSPRGLKHLITTRVDLVEIFHPRPQGGIAPTAQNPFQPPEVLQAELERMTLLALEQEILRQYPDVLTRKALVELARPSRVNTASIHVRVFDGQMQRLDTWLTQNHVTVVTGQGTKAEGWYRQPGADPLDSTIVEFRGPRRKLLELLYANLPIRGMSASGDGRVASVQSHRESNQLISLQALYPTAGILDSDRTDSLSDVLMDALLKESLSERFSFNVPVSTSANEYALFWSILNRTGGSIEGSRVAWTVHAGDAAGLGLVQYKSVQVSGTVSTLIQIARLHQSFDGPGVITLTPLQGALQWVLGLADSALH